jgi:ATP-dependent helicase/nuclease subunit A
VVDEARRVFYVAVTRARQRLVMSGLARPNQRGNWQGSGDGPLAWLREHYRLDLPPTGSAVNWPGPDLLVELLTAVQPQTGEIANPPALPNALDFQPEAAPYEVIFPSRLATPPAEAAALPATEPAEAGDAARLRGVVMHRALQTLALGGPLPEAPALAAALRQEGLPAAAAAALAGEIESELAACREDPFLATLVNPETPGGASEWLLEDQPRPGAIRRGVIDHLAFDGSNWWLLDFKTSRPGAGEDWEAFMARETEKYRPQLAAYREMAAKAKGAASPEAVRVALYFTACRKVVEI